MNCLCYIVVIRQRICQSGVPVTRENTYTNLNSGDTVTLLNGYTLQITSAANDSTSVLFTNSAFNLSLNFTITDNSYGLFDLPVQNGAYRVGVYLKARCCNTYNCCS